MADVSLLNAILGSGGGGVLGYIGAAVQHRRSQEGQFQARVDKELTALRQEVEKCRAERPVTQILKMGLCMVVPELARAEPTNPTLRQVANAFAALPKEDGEDFATLLKKLEEVPGTNEPDAAGQ